MPPYLESLASMATPVHKINDHSNGVQNHSNSLSNGHLNGQTVNSSQIHFALKPKGLGFANGSTAPSTGTPQPGIADDNDVYDIVVAGFGPAALAIAIAMEDALEETQGESLHDLPRKPRVAFLEKQNDFAWHAGMLLEGAKMQISFIKDLATLRNPKSRFTFLNYLHQKKRLVQFSNLNTFLPSRVEFEDYLRWCARHFDDVVSYGEEALDITPEIPGSSSTDSSSDVQRFLVRSRNMHTQKETIINARHVVIAVGGKPNIPAPFDWNQSRVIHSSQYSQNLPYLLNNRAEKYNIAVIGGGQSAAEVFDNLQHNYPKCNTHLIFRQQSLKPSDDSPFVNEVFDPERIAPFYNQPAQWRISTNLHHRNTNYGVVRLELLEKIYGTLYTQRLTYDSEEQWPHRILPNASVQSVTQTSPKKVSLRVKWTSSCDPQDGAERDFEYDLVVLATGYTHNGFEEMLRPIHEVSEKTGQWNAGKDYRLQIDGLTVNKDAGIWLQGCNEKTHGVSHCYFADLTMETNLGSSFLIPF
jgi:L-ornithine N5-oxygenase